MDDEYNEYAEYIEGLLAQIFQQAKARFGPALKSYWFNDSDRCPGCRGEIDAVKIKGQEALSLNAFVYQERGVLIGYFLCGSCAKKIFQEAQRNPYKQTELHTTIEANLIKAYKRYIRSMSA
jgi:hypothetical protein